MNLLIAQEAEQLHLDVTLFGTSYPTPINCLKTWQDLPSKLRESYQPHRMFDKPNMHDTRLNRAIPYVLSRALTGSPDLSSVELGWTSEAATAGQNWRGDLKATGQVPDPWETLLQCVHGQVTFNVSFLLPPNEKRLNTP